jgi:predicted TIM-barrel fold metal-dependent hydrolase
MGTGIYVPREDLLSDPAWQEGYRVLAEFGLSFDLLIWPAQLPQATDGAERTA